MKSRTKCGVITSILARIPICSYKQSSPSRKCFVVMSLSPRTVRSGEVWRTTGAVDQINPSAILQLLGEFGGLPFGHHSAARRNYAPICAQHSNIAVNDLAEHLAFDLRADIQKPSNAFRAPSRPVSGGWSGGKNIWQSGWNIEVMPSRSPSCRYALTQSAISRG